MLQVHERFNDEVLPVEDEALSCFLDTLLGQVRTIRHLDVLARRNLPLFEDFLIVYFIAHLMAVRERIVLSDFAQDVGLSNLCRDKQLLELEAFFLDIVGDIYFRVGLVCGQKELLSQVRRLRHANE